MCIDTVYFKTYQLVFSMIIKTNRQADLR